MVWFLGVNRDEAKEIVYDKYILYVYIMNAAEKEKPRKVTIEDGGSYRPTPSLNDDEIDLVWYSQKEINKFKVQAARDAGVDLFDIYNESPPSSFDSEREQQLVDVQHSQDEHKHSPNEHKQSPGQYKQSPDQYEQSTPTTPKEDLHMLWPDEQKPSPDTNPSEQGKDSWNVLKKFVMVGDFDSKFEDDATALTDAATCETTHQCSNDFNDFIDPDGREVCQRGLGFHFSRYRRNNRKSIRTSVLTWRDSMDSILLEKDGERDSLPPDKAKEVDDRRHEKSTRILAKLYRKYSKEEQELALWRGKMDYEIAYPQVCSFNTSNVDSNQSMMPSSNESLSIDESIKKRAAGGEENLSHAKSDQNLSGMRNAQSSTVSIKKRGAGNGDRHTSKRRHTLTN
eukprot:scaffold16368_cov73-Cyclotella_meneghiniana.AAC.3